MPNDFTEYPPPIEKDRYKIKKNKKSKRERKKNNNNKYLFEKRPRRRPVRVRSRGVPASNNPDWAGRLLHFSLSPPNSYGPAKPSNHRFVQFSLRGLPSRSRQKTRARRRFLRPHA
jgi:hypothetical protein